MKSWKFGVIGMIFMFILFLAGLVGYGMNIFKLVKCDFEAPYKTEIVRSISIIPIVGVFTGWMDIGEENK